MRTDTLCGEVGVGLALEISSFVIVLRASSAVGQTGGGEGRCGDITGSLELVPWLVLDVYSVGIVLCMGRGGEWGGGAQPICVLSGGVC
jgi:hypothetical protein